MSDVESAPSLPDAPELHFHKRLRIGMDMSGESEIISPTKPRVEVGECLVGFLFSVYEEDGKLFLFMKLDDCHRTICVEYDQCEYCLQFLPSGSDKDGLIAEVLSSIEECGGEVKSFEFRQLKYAFDDDSIPFETEWLVVNASGSCDVTQIPREGANYRAIFGTTSPLWETFCLKHGIKGPEWVEITGFEESGSRCLSIPSFHSTKSFELRVLQDYNINPRFNLCSFAIQMIGTQLVMISAKITTECDTMEWSDVSETLTFTTLSPDIKPSGTVLCKSEADLIQSFVETLESYDIDVMISFNLRSDFEILYQKMCENEVMGWWRVGRIRRGFVNPSLEDRMYDFIGGRIRCDLRDVYLEFCRPDQNSFSAIVKTEFGIERQSLEAIDIATEIQDQAKLHNLLAYNHRDADLVERLARKIQLLPLTLQLAQLSGCSWSHSLYGRVSYRCEALFVFAFGSAGYVIPERGVNSKSSLGKREVQYEGGLVLEPSKGFYDNCVLLLDFNSLYPSIIREYNLCFSTLRELSADVSDEEMIAYSKVIKESQTTGVLPSIMEELMEARSKVKLEIAQTDDQQKLKTLDIRQKAIKILSNAMYGYLGSPISRFLSVHIAKMITCLGRNVLEETVTWMQEHGHTVLYGDTDSVFVATSTKDPDSAKTIADTLCLSIYQNYRVLKLGLEKVISKLLLANKKKYAFMDASGQVTVKGLDLIRRDWCGLSKYICSFVLDKFFHEDQPTAVQLALKEMRRIAQMLVRTNGQPENAVKRDEKPEITISDLIIHKSITKPLADYTRNSVHVSVGRWMASAGYKVNAGDTIPFIMMSNKAKNFDDKAWHPSRVSCVRDVDVNYYIGTQLIPPLIRLCEPFGAISNEEIKAAFGVTPSAKPEPVGTRAELEYTCPACQSKMGVEKIVSMKCWRCKTQLNWKSVANELTRQLHKMLTNWTVDNGIVCKSCMFRTVQLPLIGEAHFNRGKEKCTRHLQFEVRNLDVYQNLKNMLAQVNGMKGDNVESEACRNYMNDMLVSLLDSHGLNRLRISTILRVPGVGD